MDRILKVAFAAALALALTSGVARAEHKLGVEVYPGAELLTSRSDYVGKAVGVDASCYRTTDGVAAVSAYFARIPGFASQEPNVLRRGTVDVVVRPPAVDPKTGAVSRYTSFCIMQAKD
jgi:hypothetical protein